MNTKSLISLLFLLISTLSCRKEKDLQSPKILISNPSGTLSYVIPFTLIVSGKVSDDVQIQSLNINLIKPGGSILENRSIAVQGREHDFSESFTLSDIHLSSGIYTIHIKCSDGQNFSSQYVNINVSGIEPELKKVFIQSQNNGSSALSYLDNGIFIPFITSGNSANSFQVLSYSQKIAHSTSSSDDLIIYDANTAQVLFSIPNTNSTSTFFKSIYSSELFNQFTIGTEDEKTITYSENGGVSQTIMNQNLHYSESVFRISSYVIAEEKNKINAQKKLSIYNSTSSSMLFTTSINFDISAMNSVESNEVLLWVNESGIGKLKLFDLSNGAISNVITFSGHELKDVIQVTNNEFILLSDLGIYRYDYSTLTLSPIVISSNFNYLEYDYVNEIIYTASALSLEGYVYPSGSMVGQIASIDTITGLDILYNK